ncbi:MMPL family transporter [bacterium]|nr:MMPL family transporter [bacterium]
MKLTRIALDNKPFTVMMLALLILYGVFGFLQMPRSEDPFIKPPFSSVTVVLPGGTPEDMETLVLDPLDDLVRDIEEVKHTNGTALDGVASLWIEFEPGHDRDELISEVEDKLAEAQRSFPDGVVRADVMAPSTQSVRFIQIALVSDRPLRDLQRYAEGLENRLQRLPDLQEIEQNGERGEEVRVAVNPERLAELQIPLTRVIDAVQSAGMNIPGGSVQSGDKKFNVLTSGDFESLKQIEHVVVAGSAVSPVYLKEVADVEYAYADRQHLMRINGADAVVVTARMKPGRNIFTVMEQVNAEVKEFDASLPSDIQLQWVFKQSDAVEYRLNDFYINLGQGIVLVGLIMTLALGFRPSVIVMLAIPLSFTIAIGFIDLAGYAIQQMTIAAMIIALGLLVDNGIVVTENINRFLIRGIDRPTAAREGTAQVGSAVSAATLTTMLAFVPMAMMADVSGDFIRSMPISVMLILASSLLVALTFSPMAASKIMRPVPMDKQPYLTRRLYGFVQGPYLRALKFGLRHRWLVLGIATLALFGAIALFPLVGVSFFPKAEKPIFVVDVELPKGSSLDATDRALSWTEEQILSVDEVELVSANLGRGQPSFYYNMVPGAEKSNFGQLFVRTRSDIRGEKLGPVLESLRERLRSYPGARFKVIELEQGPHAGDPIAVRIYGENKDQLEAISHKVEDAMASVPGAVNVDNPYATRATNVRVEIDRDKAAMFGIPLHEIDRIVRTALAGWEAADYRDDRGEEYPVMVRLPSGENARMQDFMRIYLPTASGAQVPLQEVAEIRLESGHSLVQRRDGRRMVSITAATSGRPTAEVEAYMQAAVDQLDIPEGIDVEFGGESEARGESFSSMYSATSIAIVGIYAVLVLMFRSNRQPLIIFAALPQAFIGSILALFITGNTFSFTAFVGLTSLVGIVVNNSILLVDMTNQNRRSGLERREAVLEAGTSRFVPIVLTTLTTIFGLLPLTLRGGTLWGPMGWVIIGGLLTSTFLTLIVVPILYELFSKKEWDVSATA